MDEYSISHNDNLSGWAFAGSVIHNANNNTNINLSSVGSGSSHTLTAAFDGVNQNFKATHSGGSDVRINNSTQLQIAINNVIQIPNWFYIPTRKICSL